MARGNWKPEVINAAPRCRLCRKAVKPMDFVRLDGIAPAHRQCAVLRSRTFTEGREIEFHRA